MTNQEAKNYWEEFLGEIEGLKRSNSSVDWEAQEQATRKAINALEKQISLERIVERLEGRIDYHAGLYAKSFSSEDRGACDAYDDAIEIVKEEGGLNEKKIYRR